MSSDSHATWLPLLDEKKSQVNAAIGQGCESPTSERDFRSMFEKLCRYRRVRRFSQLEAKILPSFENITELTDKVGESAGLTPSDCLTGLIWWTAFAVIESGCRAGAQIGQLSTLLADLNCKVPKFSSSIGRFPKEGRVQKPLQDTYGAFIDAQLFVFRNFDQRQYSSGYDPTDDAKLREHIDETGKILDQARGRFDLQANQAASDEERKKSEKYQPQLEEQRTLPGVIHDDSIRDVREVHVRFVSIKKLGGGSFGEVDEVRELSTGSSYARKHIHFDREVPEEAIEEAVKNEVQIMQKLHHQHIATVLFYLKEEGAFSIFMLPVGDSDLRRFLGDCEKADYPVASTKQIYPWFGCLLDALAYAHKLEIKHRDIKPSNILIKNNQPYLCDFGLATDFSEQIISDSRGQKVHGSLAYRAPEKKPGERRGRRADVFALGCVYSEMFTVTQKKSLDDYRNARNTKGSLAFRDCLPKIHTWLNEFKQKGLNEVLVDMIVSMMNEDDEIRPSSQKAVNEIRHERALFCVE